MKAIVQRVNWARVSVGDETVGEIGPGLCVLVGVAQQDNALHAKALADKIWHLRILADDAGVMNRSLAEEGGGVLVISQFTLYADTARGRRPSWAGAAAAAVAEPLVDAVAGHLGELGATVAQGRFGAHMRVALENDGPVTIPLEI